MLKTIRCYAEGRPGHWEAFCLEFDIAVNGPSFEAVYRDLHKAIGMYLETVSHLPEVDRDQLLHRRAPLGLRLKFLWFALRHAFTGRGDGTKRRAEFTLDCPAYG